ncbi:MAG TPA: alkaline phosphatase family protein, partial [Pyrinomonadaceae bacterium]|nr:alkaline phosphatase family protein [Pyrinomonadaceae bacterium]
FDEHGGGFDHVAPPTTVSPDAKDFNMGQGQDNFDFKRLGLRVPMVMVSAHIAENTIVNTPMHHCSFLQTMQQKWGLPSLGPRQDSAPPFTEVFTSNARTLDTWPDWKDYPGGSPTLDLTRIGELDLSAIRLNELQLSILNAIREFYVGEPALSSKVIMTAQDAREFLEQAEKLRHRRRALAS